MREAIFARSACQSLAGIWLTIREMRSWNKVVLDLDQQGWFIWMKLFFSENAYCGFPANIKANIECDSHNSWQARRGQLLLSCVIPLDILVWSSNIIVMLMIVKSSGLSWTLVTKHGHNRREYLQIRVESLALSELGSACRCFILQPGNIISTDNVI